MRIAMIAPIGERVPPIGYGGTERMVGWLTEALVQRGHQVVLYASADSATSAELSGWPARPLRGEVPGGAHTMLEMAHLLRTEVDLGAFDVVHGHLGLESAALTRSWQVPSVHTIHGAIFPPQVPLMRALSELTWISISDSQRRPCPQANYAATIHHGLPLDDYPFFADTHREYLLHLGRIAPEKGTHLAIDAAQRAGENLIIAAKVDSVDQAYFEREIVPRLELGGVHYVGEVGHAAKIALLSRAKALLFPICWEEPFGLVMIEAMACGTPVIAMPNGSVPEIVVHGQTGYWTEDLNDMVGAIARIDRLSSHACRQHVERHFSLEQMVTHYERLYAEVAAVSVSY